MAEFEVDLWIDYLDVCTQICRASCSLKFLLVFGEGNIGYSLNRIDLWTFKCTKSIIDKHRDRRFGFHIQMAKTWLSYHSGDSCTHSADCIHTGK